MEGRREGYGRKGGGERGGEKGGLGKREKERWRNGENMSKISLVDETADVQQLRRGLRCM